MEDNDKQSKNSGGFLFSNSQCLLSMTFIKGGIILVGIVKYNLNTRKICIRQ